MNEDPTILSTTTGHVTEIVIHNPRKRNAMSYRMWIALGDALEPLQSSSDTRVVVLRGEGDKAFCAGNDISEFGEWRDDPARHREYDAASGRAVRALAAVPVPVIARIEGVCVGGGMELALLADLRIAADNARFAITPARLGLGYKLEDVELVVARAGAAAARRLLFTARMHDAHEAKALGLVDEICAPGDIVTAVAALAGEIAANAPLSVRALKAAIGEALKPPGERDRAAVQVLVDACHASADYREGQRAFRDKRPAVFEGR